MCFVWRGSGRLRFVSGRGGHGRLPGVSGEQAAQHVEGTVSVLAGGVDVAADVQPVPGGVFAGEPAGDLLLGLGGPYSALADIVRRPHGGVTREAEHVVLAVAAEFEQE